MASDLGPPPLYPGMLLCPFHLTDETFRIVCFIGFLSAFFLVDFWVYVQVFFQPTFIYVLLDAPGWNSSTGVGGTC